MSSNSLVSQTPPLGAGNSGPQIVVDALTRLIRDQFPAIVPGAAISAALVRQVFDFVKQNLTVLLSGVLTTAGLAVLLPSLAVVLVNLAGFSASGVVAGSLAAAIQASIYGGSTGGMFAVFQSFGATAVVAPPVAALGGTLLVIGAGVGGYWLYQKRQRRLAAEAQAAGNSDSNDNDDDDEHPPKENQPLITRRSTQFNIFDTFRRSSSKD